MKLLIPLIAALILAGCMEREIYSELSDPSRIGHPPSSVQVIDLSGNLKTALKTDPHSTTKIEVYVHRTACNSASAKALGSDFDGYVRITIFDNSRTIARAQMDYKGEPSQQMIQKPYETLITKLQWSKQ